MKKPITRKIISILCALTLLFGGWGEYFPSLSPSVSGEGADDTRTLTATDGSTYQVSVVFDQDSGIPDDAVLTVTGIGTEDGLYGNCVAQCAEQTGKPADVFTEVKAFDISMQDAVTDEECHPTGSFQIKIKLLKQTQP